MSDSEDVKVADAKRRFSELIDRVARGERFIVSRRGKPALGLVPPGEVEAGSSGRRPLGMAAFVGVLADEGALLEEIAREAYQNRRKAKDRPPPEL